MITTEQARTMSLDSIMMDYKHEFHEVLCKAQEHLKHDLIQWYSRDADYEIAFIDGKDFRLVLYPHKTSAGNYHIRVRICAGSANRKVAEYFCQKLAKVEPYSCHFTKKK